MADKPEPEQGARRTSRAADDPGEDTEGHSLSLIMGLGALERARVQDRTRHKIKDEELPPLSKPFPSMKDEKRK